VGGGDRLGTLRVSELRGHGQARPVTTKTNYNIRGFLNLYKPGRVGNQAENQKETIKNPENQQISSGDPSSLTGAQPPQTGVSSPL